jgi:hypothetical protein
VSGVTEYTFHSRSRKNGEECVCVLCCFEFELAGLGDMVWYE